MKRMSLGFVMVAALATALSTLVISPLYAQQEQKGDRQAAHETSVGGRWSMSLDSPHGTISVNLVLEQRGTKITGSFSHADGGGEFPIEGEFTADTLTLSATVDDAHHGTGSMQVALTGRLHDDGTLAGNLSGSMGEMTWTATRVKSL